MKFKVKSYWFVFIAFVAISNANAQTNELLTLQELCAQPYFDIKTDTLKDKSKVYKYKDLVLDNFSKEELRKKDTFDIDPSKYTNIQELDISGEFMPVPENIFKFKKLQKLSMHNNANYGSVFFIPINLPDDFYNLDNLKILKVGASYVMFDHRIERLKNLEVIIITGVNSVIPEMFYKLPKLKILKINTAIYYFENGIFLSTEDMNPFIHNDSEEKKDTIYKYCSDFDFSLKKLLSMPYNKPDKYWRYKGKIKLYNYYCEYRRYSSKLDSLKMNYKDEWVKDKKLNANKRSIIVHGKMKAGQPSGKWKMEEHGAVNHEYKDGILFRSWYKSTSEMFEGNFNHVYSNDGRYSTFTYSEDKGICFIKYDKGSSMYGYIKDSTGILRDFTYFNTTKYDTKFLKKNLVEQLHEKQKIKDEVFLNCDECVYVNAKLNGLQKIYNDAKTAFVEIPFKDDKPLAGKYKIKNSNKTVENFIEIE